MAVAMAVAMAAVMAVWLDRPLVLNLVAEKAYSMAVE